METINKHGRNVAPDAAVIDVQARLFHSMPVKTAVLDIMKNIRNALGFLPLTMKRSETTPV